MEMVYYIQYILEPKLPSPPNDLFSINFPLIKSIDFTICQSSGKDLLYIE